MDGDPPSALRIALMIISWLWIRFVDKLLQIIMHKKKTPFSAKGGPYWYMEKFFGQHLLDPENKRV